MVEQLTLNQLVLGSSPSGGTKTSSSFSPTQPENFVALSDRDSRRRVMNATFSLSETWQLGGDSFTWRLKDSEIRFRGSGRFAELVDKRIPASDESVRAFFEALNTLDVWSWRDDNALSETEYDCLDGSTWKFSTSLGSKICKTGGTNAYSSLDDPRKPHHGEGQGR